MASSIMPSSTINTPRPPKIPNPMHRKKAAIRSIPSQQIAGALELMFLEDSTSTIPAYATPIPRKSSQKFDVGSDPTPSSFKIGGNHKIMPKMIS
jgi:electron transfer flavoprotein alpha/beta subunit